MPSLEHEFLVDLIRDNPHLLLSLLHDALGLLPPPYTELRPGEADLTQLLPTEFRADLVLVFYFDGQPVYALVVEVQLSCDPAKKKSWPLYWAAERAKLGCPVGVVVLALSEEVARWAGRLIGDGNPGGGSLLPVVLGPGQIPRVTDGALARGAPDLAMMSLMAHAGGPGLVAMAEAAVQGLQTSPADKAKLYYDVLVLVLHEACRQGLLEKQIMDALLDKYKDRFKEVYALFEARGEARGEVKSILRVLRARGIALSEEAKNRILACGDLSLLDRWLDRAVTVSSESELFADS